jgi:hypothetical protein
MKNVKTHTSDRWLDALIESLTNQERSVGYIEAVLEEKIQNPNYFVQH